MLSPDEALQLIIERGKQRKEAEANRARLLRELSLVEAQIQDLSLSISVLAPLCQGATLLTSTNKETTTEASGSSA